MSSTPPSLPDQSPRSVSTFDDWTTDLDISEASNTSKDEFAAYVELLYLRNGEVPTAEVMRKAIPGCRISDKTFEAYLRDQQIKTYLEVEREIPVHAVQRLTTKQLQWIQIATDPSDMRPLAKKLADVGCTKADITKWNANKYYREALLERTNAAFGDGRTAILRSLQIEAMAGNTSAIKMYLEMTGDYAPQLNVGVVVEQRTVINNVVAILQELVDPKVLLEVVERLEQEAVPNHPAAAQATRPALPPMSKQTQKATVIDVPSYTNDMWG